MRAQQGWPGRSAEIRDYWTHRARVAARKLVVQLGILKYEHIPRIETICARYKIKIVRVALDGAAAQLVRTQHGIEIQVSDRIIDVGAFRFAVAHELAHYMLGHPSLPPHRLGMRGAFVASNGRDYEAEANAYASELLMPDFLVRGDFDLDRVSLDLARQIADRYHVSILASGTRIVELSAQPCAAVFSTRGGKISWFRPSDAFTAALGHELPRGESLPPESLAWNFFVGGTLDERQLPVKAGVWCAHEVIEHSTASIEYETVLSLLWKRTDALQA